MSDDRELLQDSIGSHEGRRLCLWLAGRMDSWWLVRRAAAEIGRQL